jgi:membrane protease YdiL (CAAX protease family)
LSSSIQFGIGGIVLVLAFITDRFFKDPAVEKPVFKKKKLVGILIVYLLAYLMVLYWSWLARQGLPSSELTGSCRDIIPQVVLMAIVFMFLLGIERVRPSCFGFCLPKSWWVLVPPFVFFSGASLLNLNWAREMEAKLLIGGTLLVVTEQVIFQGFIQNELERTFGIKWMWIIAGLLFGLWHLPTDFWGYQFLHQRNALYSFGQLAMQMGGGLWAAAIYKKTRSLYPLMLFHWIGNNYHLHLFFSIKRLF